ncbi:hypothetical protein NM688_g4946 [Phlebia brevispora]|uniref:Uncharacterized protein n=1 Tax=Phlebia brevispora TaxID=194682 RepID=A0ACC1T1K7_9APHY|nr:hypothetical protein NM688_g4946 [Phlebia brevispora]
MSSTNSTSDAYRAMYVGRASDAVLFMGISAQFCFVATLYAAYWWLRVNKRRRQLFSGYKISKSSRNMVVVLLSLGFVHALAAFLFLYFAPADISFGSQMKINAMSRTLILVDSTYLCQSFSVSHELMATQAVTVFVCQVFILHSVYKARGCGKLLLILNFFVVVFALAVGVGESLFGQVFLDHTLAAYLSLATMSPSVWNVFHVTTMFPAPSSNDEKLVTASSVAIRMSKLINNVFFLYCLVMICRQVPYFFYWLYYKPSVYWIFMDLIDYELIGNTYPCLVIALISIPDFGTWEHEDAAMLPPSPSV